MPMTQNHSRPGFALTAVLAGILVLGGLSPVRASLESPTLQAKARPSPAQRKLKTLEKTLALNPDQRDRIQRILEEESAKKNDLSTQMESVKDQARAGILEVLDENQRVKFNKKTLRRKASGKRAHQKT